ncbi:MAG: hypothetical protein LBD38_00680 [Streptococcaceae bacterium]|jgi:hypothetical protein|nr:hypothetical protein [Streptococcaceae bacterium]
MKKGIKGLTIGLCATAAILCASGASAAQKEGDAIIKTSTDSILKLNPGTLTFASSDALDFGSATLGLSSQTKSATELVANKPAQLADAKTLAVLDLRGGDKGWYITAKAGDLYLNGNSASIDPTEKLPTSLLKVQVGDESTAISGVTSAKVTGTSAVDIYGQEPTVATGAVDALGLHVSGNINGEITFGATDQTKAGDYKGVIDYTLVDSVTPVTP